MAEWGPVWHLSVPVIFPQCLHLYVTTGGLQGQGGSERVREGQGGSERVREGQGGSGRVREGLAGWKAIWLDTYMRTCKAMGLLLLAEKICSRMGLRIACRGENGMEKAKGEEQNRPGRRKDMQRRVARKGPEAENYHNAWFVLLKSAEKGRMGSKSGMVTAEEKGRARAKSKGSHWAATGLV